VEFEWDTAKEAENRRKHGVSFTAAAYALEDPRKIELIDDRFDYSEERIQSICAYRGTVLFVVSVMRSENLCRIISARKATRNEQNQYLQGGPLLA